MDYEEDFIEGVRSVKNEIDYADTKRAAAEVRQNNLTAINAMKSARLKKVIEKSQTNTIAGSTRSRCSRYSLATSRRPSAPAKEPLESARALSKVKDE